MKVMADNGADKTKPFHALTAICMLPKNIFPKHSTKSIWMKLSDGRRVMVRPIIYSAETIGLLGKSLKRDIDNVVKMAKAVYCNK